MKISLSSFKNLFLFPLLFICLLLCSCDADLNNQKIADEEDSGGLVWEGSQKSISGFEKSNTNELYASFFPTYKFADFGQVSVIHNYLEHSNNTVRVHTGDFNGDGRTDILRTWDHYPYNRLFIATPSGFIDYGEVKVIHNHLEHSNKTVRIHLGDFNGDGKTDILRTWDDYNYNRLFISTGAGFMDFGKVTVIHGHLQHSNNTVRIHLGDFNGDGKTDILRTWDHYQNNRLFISNGYGFVDRGPVNVIHGHLQHSNNTVRIHLGDFNGDGKTDILRTWDHYPYNRIFISTGHGFVDGGQISVIHGHLEHSNRTVRIHLGDFNGDGKTDILRTWDHYPNNRLFISIGTRFIDYGEVGVSDGYLQHSNNTVRIHLGDFNGDGKTDILRTWDDFNLNRLFISTGFGFADYGQVNVTNGHLQHSNRTVRIHLGDYNGDGKTDLLRTWDTYTLNRLFISVVADL